METALKPTAKHIIKIFDSMESHPPTFDFKKPQAPSEMPVIQESNQRSSKAHENSSNLSNGITIRSPLSSIPISTITHSAHTGSIIRLENVRPDNDR
jgi:hypothetical protein